MSCVAISLVNKLNDNGIECWSGDGSEQSLNENGTRNREIQECGGGIDVYRDGGEEEIEGSSDISHSFTLVNSFLNCMCDPYENSLLVYDLENVLYYGAIRMNDRCYEIRWCLDKSQVVMVDLRSHEMSVYDSGKLRDDQHTMGVIDIDVNGRRWEGGVKNGKPFGYGILYDEEGRKEYEGFMVDGRRVCYGMEFSSDIVRLMYHGCYCNGKRCGKGVLYDRNGVMEYDGVWKNDNPYAPELGWKTIDNHTESVEIPKNSLNEVKSVIFFSWLHSLKRIVIGKNCFGRVRIFELDGLIELESVEIESRSFANATSWDSVRNDNRPDGLCRIENCPKLKSIQIGAYAFSDYHSFEVKNLPRLQSIEIAKKCFFHAVSFSLAGLFDWLI